MIKIFVIEDHVVTSAGIRSLFRSSRDAIAVTGCVTRVEEALEKADPAKIDLFLLDLWLHSTDPIQNLRLLQRKFPGKPIVVFTSEESPIWQQKMMEAGAMGYIIKTSSRSEIKSALERVMQGQAVFSVSIETFDKERGFTTSSVGVSNSLSRHQHELLTLLAQGYPQYDIAKKLGIAVSTVEKSLKHLRQKFEVKSNSELIRWATAHRLI
ncbi:MAG: response regulator transcription factor [bacterium]